MVFPVVMYGCESWTIKKADHRRIDVFELWYWKRLLRVPWAARSQSNHSTLKGISPECSLEELMLKLKLQYFGHLMRRTDSLKKPLMLGKIEGRRRGWWQEVDDRGWDGWMASLPQCTWVWASSSSWWWTGKSVVLQSLRLQSWTRLKYWTEQRINYKWFPEDSKLEWITRPLNMFPHIIFKLFGCKTEATIDLENKLQARTKDYLTLNWPYNFFFFNFCAGHIFLIL